MDLCLLARIKIADSFVLEFLNRINLLYKVIKIDL